MDQLKRHILSIDSKNRSSGSNEEFVIHLNENEFHQVKYVQLKDVAFPNTMYNITTSNNVLNWQTAVPVSYSLTIPIGSYTADELVTYINSITSTIITYTTCPIQFVNNTKTRKFKITSTSAFILLSSSTILNVIGFAIPSITYLLEQTGTELYNFIVTKFIHVISASLAEADALISSNGKKYSVIATIPVDVPFGYMISRTEEKTSSDESLFNANTNLSTIDMRFVDSNFQTINLNGSNIMMTFSISRN